MGKKKNRWVALATAANEQRVTLRESCDSDQCQSDTQHVQALRTIPVLFHGHVSYTNLTHFSQSSLIYEISCLLTFCPYSMKVTENTWKCVTTLVKKNVSVKIPLHTNVKARKAALVRNYFSRRNNFSLHSSWLPSRSHVEIFNKINADVLFWRVNYLYLATPTCPVMFLSLIPKGLRMQSEIY